MNCKKADCSKCSSKSRYCGVDLTCLEVAKGDSYDSIIKKINDLLCNEFEATTYTFEDNDICENGGLRIFENNAGEETLVYETCFSCCGDASEGTFLMSNLQNVLSFDESYDIGATPFTLPFNTDTSIPSMELTIAEGGNYLLNFDFIVYSTYDLIVNYRVIVNDTPYPVLSKGVIIDGSTPPTHTSTYVLNTVLSNLTPLDKVNIEFKSIRVLGDVTTPGNIFITSATLILNKI